MHCFFLSSLKSQVHLRAHGGVVTARALDGNSLSHSRTHDRSDRDGSDVLGGRDHLSRSNELGGRDHCSRSNVIGGGNHDSRSNVIGGGNHDSRSLSKVLGGRNHDSRGLVLCGRDGL
jgi:hypothetical protein